MFCFYSLLRSFYFVCLFGRTYVCVHIYCMYMYMSMSMYVYIYMYMYIYMSILILYLENVLRNILLMTKNILGII